jgi:hypothetical protein
MSRRNRNPQRILKKGYLIIGDGKTESWYFSQLKKHVPLSAKITLSPPLPIKRSLTDIEDEINEQLQHFDKVFWIVDLDTIIADQQIDRFKKIYQRLLKKRKHPFVFINNPCLEFWFLLHFEQTSRPFSSCEEVVRALKTYPEMANYNKSEKYYKNPRRDIYQRLKDRLDTAKSNAALLGSFDNDNPKKALAEINMIFSELEFD